MSTPHKAPNQPAPEENSGPSASAQTEPNSWRILVPPESLPPEPAIAAIQVSETSAAAPPTHTHPALPEDLRVPWHWGDIFGFAIFYLGINILLVLVLSGMIAGARNTSARALLNDKQFQVDIALVAQALSSALALGYFWVLIHARGESRFWWRLGWRPLRSAPGKGARAWRFVWTGVGLAVVAATLDSLIPQKQELPIEKMFETAQAIALFACFGILVAPFIEETIFRGFLYPVVARSAGIPAGIIITGVVFGMFHAAQIWGGWAQIAVIMVVGIVLTWVRARQETVLASFLIHLSYNTAITLFGVIGSIGLHHR